MVFALLLDLDLSRSLSRQRVSRNRLNTNDTYNDRVHRAYRVTKYMFVHMESLKVE